MAKIDVTIKGISPLLQHRFSEGEEKIKKSTGVKDYSGEAEKALYKDETGQIYFGGE